MIEESFGSTSTTFVYDAGNLVDDGQFIFTYDAWNRMVKAQSKLDSDVVVATYAYDGLGRRIKKVVTNSGGKDGTELYYYDGQQVIEVRDGSEAVVRQIFHGTQYIDEVVAEKLENGFVFVHQDANWNVIALTDFAGRVLESVRQTPYGVATVDQESMFGDYNGDGFVTLAEADTDTMNGFSSGDTCFANPTGACRIYDFDFDGDVDSTDATTLDNLISTVTYRRPGQSNSAIGNERFHQGLILDGEIGMYNNRAREYDPSLRRFVQRNPLMLSSENFVARERYLYSHDNHVNNEGSLGTFSITEEDARNDPRYCLDLDLLGYHRYHRCYREINIVGGPANHICFLKADGSYDDGESHRDCVGPATHKGIFGECLFLNLCLVLRHLDADVDSTPWPGCPMDDPL